MMEEAKARPRFNVVEVQVVILTLLDLMPERQIRKSLALPVSSDRQISSCVLAPNALLSGFRRSKGRGAVASRRVAMYNQCIRIFIQFLMSLVSLPLLLLTLGL